MIQKLLTTLTLVLAINFVGVIALVGYFVATGKLDREKIAAIKATMFEPKPGPATQPSTQPATQPSMPGPLASLDALITPVLDRPATEQVAFLQRRFETQTAVLDRRERELADQARQVTLAREELARSLAAKTASQAAVPAAKQGAEDAKGFDASLELVASLPAKQAKAVLSGMDDAVLLRYLRAMDGAAATKIVKEFKSPEEIGRVQRILDLMRNGPKAAEPPTALVTGTP